jgi:hypothetical protein
MNALVPRTGICVILLLVSTFLVACPVEKKESLRNPVTVLLKLDGSLRDQINKGLQDPKFVVHLHIAGSLATMLPEAPIGLRIFLNKPDATSETSVEDDHYVSGLSFPDQSVSTENPQANKPSFSMVRNIGPVLQRLKAKNELRLDQGLKVTVVVVPSTVAEKTELLIQVKKAEIKLPPQK